jgi:predicted amino acid-binding ACT domain protein
MADTIQRIEYYYVTVPDKPGTGAGVLTALKEAGVNLVAYLGFPSGRGKSQIDLVPEDAAAFKQAAVKAGLKLSRVKKAFLVQGDDRPGAVADITRKLAEAKINVTAAAATAAGSGRYGMILWVPPARYEKAAKALGV